MTAQDSASVVLKRISDANARFGFALLSKLVQSDTGKNVFISPTSVSTVLAMTCDGAAGQTRSAMVRTLGLDSMDWQAVNDAYALIMTSMGNEDSFVTMLIANSMWANAAFEVRPDFQDDARRFYQAEVDNLNFTSPESPRTINAWVSRKTGEKIDKIVDDLSPQDALVLVNAVYFNGTWRNTFDTKLTKEKPFFAFDGTVKNVQMMSQSGRYKYLKGENFQAISLPYGTGKFEMTVVLPDSSLRVDRFLLDEVTASTWDAWLSRMRVMNGDIQLPRFKVEGDYTLNEALAALGMSEAFDRSKADFSGMVNLPPDQNAYISQVRHRTYIDVNEKGSEAAAVTSVTIGATSGVARNPNAERFKMIVDRPFLCFLRDGQSGTLLFAGIIMNP